MLSKSEQIEIQFIIYTKGWYKKSNIINDIAVFQGKWCGMDPKFVTPKDALWFVSMVYEKYVKHKMSLFDIVKGAYEYPYLTMDTKKSIKFEDIIEFICSEIRQRIMTADIPEWPMIDCDEYLPYDNDDSLKRWNDMHAVV